MLFSMQFSGGTFRYLSFYTVEVSFLAYFRVKSGIIVSFLVYFMLKSGILLPIVSKCVKMYQFLHFVTLLTRFVTIGYQFYILLQLLQLATLSVTIVTLLRCPLSRLSSLARVTPDSRITPYCHDSITRFYANGQTILCNPGGVVFPQHKPIRQFSVLPLSAFINYSAVFSFYAS